jgi:hypothetical protein
MAMGLGMLARRIACMTELSERASERGDGGDGVFFAGDWIAHGMATLLKQLACCRQFLLASPTPLQPQLSLTHTIHARHLSFLAGWQQRQQRQQRQQQRQQT